MTILSTELQAFKSEVVTNEGTNGGRMSANLITSGVLQNVFPHVFKAEREAGSTVRRKIFFKNSNDNDETLINSNICLDGPTEGEDYVYFHIGTQDDTADDITGSEQKYSSGLTAAIANASEQTLIVDVEDAELTGQYVAGGKIRISSKPTPDSGTGEEEEQVISGTPSVSGTQVTMTLADVLANTYAIGSKVSPVYEPGDVECSVTDLTKTGLTYDEVANPIQCDNIGTIYQEWTITGQDASNFTCVGNTVGAVASGQIGTDFSPMNPDWDKPFFTLPANAITALANGNTLVFTTNPAGIPIWETRVVPAGAASMASNSVTAIFGGES